MRELHESVYRCAAVIHANIVSNKASVNNQKLRHSSSANSKIVGPPPPQWLQGLLAYIFAARKQIARKYFRGMIFSREDIFARGYFREKIFSREDIFAGRYFRVNSI